MINENAEALSGDVAAVMAATPEPRLREIMMALTHHLHAFVRETRLTEAEFREATAILARMGRLTTDTHNEFVLMAGSLGVSALVCLSNNGSGGATETSQNLLGPFWRMHSPWTENGASIVRSATPGPPMWVAFRFVDRAGRPIVGAEVDVWHTSPDGLYENQDEAQADMNLRGKFSSDADGFVRFRSVKPIGYPLPTDGVVGDMLRAQGRHAYRPAHVHALAFKPGYKTLITQVYADDDPRIHSDVQFGVTPALLGRFVRHETREHGFDGPWWSLEHTLIMEPGDAVLPRPPIK